MGLNLKKALGGGLAALNFPLVTGAAAGALIGGGADVYSAYQQGKGQEEANAANIASAREQMAFQERMTNQQQNYQTEMSNTAHQREVADLKAAGLNPVLSANSGASTPAGGNPSGASATSMNAAPDYSGIVSPHIQTALNARRLQQDIFESESRIQVNRSNKDNIDTDTDVKKGGWLSKFGSTTGRQMRQIIDDIFSGMKKGAQRHSADSARRDKKKSRTSFRLDNDSQWKSFP